MKSTVYFRPAVSLLFIFCTAMFSNACGPENPLIPTPAFFALPDLPKTMSAYYEQENLRLWQSLTDKDIPLNDIEQAVYKDSAFDFQSKVEDSSESDGNKFYAYLHNTNDLEISSLLYTAKLMEERRAAMQSPWYYPDSREWDNEPCDFENLIRTCKEYKGSRLKDRYGLQCVRAYFASRRFSECIEYYDSVFCDVADDNLMKRMSQRYVAGCWANLGDTARADAMFADGGDIWSLTRSDKVEYMAKRNPEAPQIMEYIRDNTYDTTFMKKCAVTAMSIVNDKRVKNKGDWNYLIAYVSNEFNNNGSMARSRIRQALRQDFSTDEFAELARAYKMKLDAQAGDMSSLYKDLQWIEAKADVTNTQADNWEQRLRNIVYIDWIPTLWKKKDYATAILLCSYADNFRVFDRWQCGWLMDGDGDYHDTYEIRSIQDLRDSEVYINEYDYACFSFQLMGSLSSSRLASTYAQIKSSTPLYNFLRRKARTDSDYYNELIGTLALREENYDRAVSYLSRVSQHYQRTMNVYKCGYLSRDPFIAYTTRWHTVEPSYPGEEPRKYDFAAGAHTVKLPQTNVKLNFAKQMRGYARTMKHGKTADERGMARLMYAIGRRNSFEECWALTQYWCGSTPNLFEPYIECGYYNDLSESTYSFLYDYYKHCEYERTEALFESETKAAIAMMSTDEARAKAEYILWNLKTVVKRYSATQTAQFVRTSCDNWKKWI